MQGCRNTNGLVADPADLKEGPVLALELNLLVVHTPRHVNHPIGFDEQFLRKLRSFHLMVGDSGHVPSLEGGNNHTVLCRRQAPGAKLQK